MNPKLLLICLVFFLLFMGAGAIQPYLTPYFQEKCGMSPGTAAFIVALVYYTFAVMRFFSGYTVNRIGVKTSIAVGALFYFFFVTATAFFPSCFISSGAAVLWGIGAALLWTGSSAYILNISREGRYGFSAGLHRLSLQAGLIIGFLTLAELIHTRNSYAGGFRFAVFACAAGFICTLFLARMSRGPQFISFRSLFRDFLSRKLLTVSGYLFVTGISYGIILNVFNRFVRGMYGYSSYKYTLVLFYVAGGLSSFLMGSLSDRKGRGMVISCGFACGMAAALITVFSHSLVSLAVSSFLLGIMFQSVPTAVTARIGDTVSPEQRPAVIARVFVWRDAGIAAAIQTAGFFKAETGDVTRLFSIFLPLFTAACIISVFETSGNRRREGAGR